MRTSEAGWLSRGDTLRIKRPHPMAGRTVTVTVVNADTADLRICTTIGVVLRPEQVEAVEKED